MCEKKNSSRLLKKQRTKNVIPFRFRIATVKCRLSVLPGLKPKSLQPLSCVPRLYHAEKLPKTNLVFIIADAKVTCSSCDTKPLIQEEQQCILGAQRAHRLAENADVSFNRCFFFVEIVFLDKTDGDHSSTLSAQRTPPRASAKSPRPPSFL